MQPRRPGQPPPSRRSSPPPPKKNNLPLILGAAGGGLVLLILLIVMMSGGEAPKKRKTEDVADKKPPPAAPRPDVTALENEGKSKCAAGMDKIMPRLKPDPSAPRDRVWADLESGLKLLNEGLAAYKSASDKGGKKYETGEFTRARQVALKVLCTEMEKEALTSCEKGHKIVLDCESLMSKSLEDAEKQKLITELESGKKLMDSGMALFARSNEVSGNTFDTNKYGQALKMVRGKLLELKQ